MRIIAILAALFVFAWNTATAQDQTVGIFLNDSLAYNGYTLFAPTNYEHVYLIDNCGYQVHSWDCGIHKGQMAYLLEDGSLLRTGIINSSFFSGGGICGIIDCYSWDGDLLWAYEHHSQLYHQHHDIEPLPNGNVLFLAWYKYSREDAIARGKDPQTIQNSVWMDHILEYDPSLNEIVWEWSSWDHLIQDFDPTKLYYGPVADYPQRIDINYNEIGGGSGMVDWMHTNGIDYNAELDQIIVSVRNYSEVWIIDHSTTTQQAAGSTGGIYGKGGDLLYRWGNPEAYNRGDASNKMLDAMHDPSWIPDSLADGNQIMIFNNKYFEFQSAVVVIDPPAETYGFYNDPGSNAYGPDNYNWIYTDFGFYSPSVSGAQRLPNGNTLICRGNMGYFLEVTYEEKDIVWEYQSPVSVFGPISQGEPASDIQQFQTHRYGPGYEGFEGRELIPGDPVELNPWIYDCTIYGDDSTATYIHEEISLGEIRVVNPFRDVLTIYSDGVVDASIQLVNMQGVIMKQEEIQVGKHSINTNSWPAGIYVLRIIAPDRATKSIKMVKIH